ncbi:MAG TPA: hypothetical protein VH350_02420 [Candidatus Sulfotelmatobacter sp.]|nr:hypothetical protein [Candidatus Sulfotelmatobacter sp.]
MRGKKNGPVSGPRNNESLKSYAYECGDELPLADGGQGDPGVGFIPGEELLLPWLPGVAGLGVDDPVLGVEPADPLAEFGMVPQGELLGEEPGVVFDGCVVLPGLELFGAVAGVVVFGLPLGEPAPDVV